MNSPVELGFDHRYIPGRGPAAAVTLLLLHGTGGDGDSLLQLGDTLRPGSTLLSPTGNVRERGMPRFFRRLAEGIFDHEDLMRRTVELTEFIRGAVTAYGLDATGIVAVGHSNGANIAASVLFDAPGTLAGAILFRPMVPYTPSPLPSLPAAAPVLIASGARDPLVPPENAATLAQLLRETGYDVTHHIEAAGHDLTMSDVRAARDWIDRYFPE